MILTARKISTLVGVMLILSLAATAGAGTSLEGSAEVAYVNFSADAGGREVFSGDSLTQKYSLAWSSTNLYYRSQPRFYSVTLGYDWTAFDTKVNDNGTRSELNQVLGKFRYSGEIGYNPLDQPIRLGAYSRSLQDARLQSTIYHGLIDDGLSHSLQSFINGRQSGVTFVFESDRAASAAMRQLPTLYLDYREIVNKPLGNSVVLDSKTTELSVAGLNKENNWLHYRNLKYENFRNPLENYETQRVLIGLVDQVGRRKWSALTNWINVSADGSFSNRKGINSGDYSDEYDLNFQAYATRRNWEARTLMNYNRALLSDKITEKTRVPVYVRGVWSPDLDWHVNLSAERGRELDSSGRVDGSYNNNVSLGANMFRRSSFTFSPSMAVATSKAFGGGDAYSLDLGANTHSTRYYSDKLSLAAGYHMRVRDDGTGSATSSSWSNRVDLRGDYRPTGGVSFTLREQVEYGKGTGFLDGSTVNNNVLTLRSRSQYSRFITNAAIKYIASSAFSTTLEGTHDLMTATDSPSSENFQLSYWLFYNKNDLNFRLSTKYDQRASSGSTQINNLAELQYRPNRYQNAYIKSSLDKNSSNNGDTTLFTMTQGYIHNIFSRTGVVRNLATLSEEMSFTRTAYNTGSVDTKYLALSGRYSPTEKIALYGSVKYQSERDSMTMFYNAGASMDFKLLTTNLEYYLAKRDSDNRVEKRLNASVKRKF